ncbi:MAG: MarC family protein [Planctomycetota bacterium]|nr:MarC family protein [Planctomycetota bacterium]
MGLLTNIALAFIPLFVAVDAIGIAPIFVSLTVHLEQKDKNKIILQSMLTAICLAIGFIFLGKAVFKLMGITIGDFMVAGGSILFCIAIIDILSQTKQRHIPADELGAVPLGTPLIVGPAVLTTSMLIVSQYGLGATIISVIVNILLAGLILKLSSFLIKAMGESGSKALSKIMSLLLASIAVMLIRKGVSQLIGQM